MNIGRYLTNFGVIGAFLGVLGVRRQTESMPRDWRRFLVWGAWILSLVLAFASVNHQIEDELLEQDRKEAQKTQKQQAKALKKAEKQIAKAASR